jgi:hypothetical protein
MQIPCELNRNSAGDNSRADNNMARMKFTWIYLESSSTRQMDHGAPLPEPVG